MNDSDEKEYLKGKIRGLQIVRDGLIDALAGTMPGIVADIELRVLLQGEITRILTDEIPPRVVQTPRGKGIKDALAETSSKFLGD